MDGIITDLKLDTTDSTPPPPANDSTALLLPVSTSGSPTDFLKGVVGKRVVVRLTSGVDYRGISSSLPHLASQPCFPRSVVLPRWVHEHRSGTDGGTC